MFVVIIAQGQLSDYLLRRQIWSRTAVRRIFNSIGLFVPAIALGFITVLNCDTNAVVAMICGFNGFVFSGFGTPNHADISPKYSGALFGFTNMVATIPGFLAPQLVGIITDNKYLWWVGICPWRFGRRTTVVKRIPTG